MTRSRFEVRLAPAEREALETLASTEGVSASAYMRRLLWESLRASRIPGPWQNASRDILPRYDGLADSAIDRALGRDNLPRPVRRSSDVKRASTRKR